LTETTTDEKIVISSETAPSGEKIVERSTVVYETRIESNVIETIGEKSKTQLFAKFGFMKPNAEQIRLVSIDKYYEPYLVVTGRYMIDYYRKSAFTFKVESKVQEVILTNQKYTPSKSTDPSLRDCNVIRIQGEERLTIENKTSLLLDRFGQEVNLRELPTAPSEERPEEILTAFGVKEIPPAFDLEIIRSRILKRPKDVNRVVTELFEVNERAAIYTPRFRAMYTNMRTGESKAVDFDAITGQRVQRPCPLARPF
jgi:hypothetical protein